MRVGAIILCRLDSKRLPGKVLADVAGKPLLWYVLSRCLAVRCLDKVFVATSDRLVDNPIDDYCRSQGYRIFRGPAEDVAARLLLCAEQAGLDYFFRVNADSPCLKPRLLEQALGLSRNGDWDLITNLHPRSFPYGISVELLKTSSFRKAYPAMVQAGQTEHATQYLYQHLELFRWHNILHSGEDLSSMRLTVDTAEDLHWFRSLVSRTDGAWDRVSYERILTNSGHIPRCL
jgi:spore coat polysaccharide biosynthesis protein SpsF